MMQSAPQGVGQQRSLSLGKSFPSVYASWPRSFLQPPEWRVAKSNASKDLTYYSTGARPDCAGDASFPWLELEKQAG